jgi:hypothetical protein
MSLRSMRVTRLTELGVGYRLVASEGAIAAAK